MITFYRIRISKIILDNSKVALKISYFSFEIKVLLKISIGPSLFRVDIVNIDILYVFIIYLVSMHIYNNFFP
jgi:hypothetical protein